jgi:site-specific DNA-methyltransferase (adenine-specific)
MAKLKVVMMQIKDIKPYDNNPRRNGKAVDAVAKSIKDFGFKNPIIIDKNNVIISGHTRRLAAIKLGLREVPCIVGDDMTDAQVKAFRLADNRVAELAVWDDDLLKEEMAKVVDMDLNEFGFDIGDIEEILQEETGIVTHKCPKCGCEWTAKE